MSYGQNVVCVLCQRSEETKLTGALSTKKRVTAHQNCLLFSANIVCQNSPQFDDLFGFSVSDVVEEVNRGRRLMCKKCNKRGATAGCEVKRCGKSYHYPCAVEDKAETVEDPVSGRFVLYCLNHNAQKRENRSRVNRSASSPSEHPSEAGAAQEPAPSPHKRSVGERPSGSSSDSSASERTARLRPKRRQNFNDNQQETPSKRKSKGWNRTILDDSSDPENIFAPIESDLDESENADQTIGEDAETPTECVSGNQTETRDTNIDEDGTEMEPESQAEERNMESPPVSTTNSATQTPRKYIFSMAKEGDVIVKTEDAGVAPEPTAPDPPRNCAGSPPSQGNSTPCRVTASPSCSSSDAPPAPCEATSPPAVPPSEASIDASSFWRSCNAARCTQAIFNHFTDEMNSISSRIQSDQASQEDYDLALAVMEASGKLAQIVARQRQDLEQKRVELSKAAAAMQEVVSALR
ncbi:uncharacterized protein phf11 [Brachionichthys hirsutus]|uniref:uncharacterized protein phf11 n=1 Tax=Brachionichthys hirsutus TaxID=412623 RepID=UPI003604F828